MAYTKKVNFSTTDNYGCGPEDEDDVYTREEFDACVKSGAFIDYDGHGYAVKNSLADSEMIISPSSWPNCMPDDATHVVWYNR